MARSLATSTAVVALAVACMGCSSNGNKLNGSLSQLYDLGFDKVDLVLQGSSISIQYVKNSGGDAAVLIVDFANIQNVAGSTIDLTQLDNGQPRGVLQNVGSVTTDFPLTRGTVSFDQTPVNGQHLSGSFDTTLSNPMGYTCDGDFSGTVTMQ